MAGVPGEKNIPPARIGLWVIGGVVGLYLLITGIAGIVQGG